LKQLTSVVQKRVLKKIKWLAENFESLTPLPLSADFIGSFKLRVSDYQVVYSFEEAVKAINSLRIGHRRDIYR